MLMDVLVLLTFLIWFVVIQEFLKSDEKQNNQKIIILTSAGTLLTFISTISLFKNLPI